MPIDNKKRTYSEGDIVKIDLGLPPDTVKGHEQGMRRPCVIVKPFNKLGLYTIVPLTTQSNQITRNLHYTVQLNEGIGGLEKLSYALCYQVRTISHDRIYLYVGNIYSEFSYKKIKSVLINMFQ